MLVKGLKEDAGYFPSHEYAPKFDFNPMDCTDIVIGTARGNYHRVLDYYTRDRSTPRVDTFWGGHDDITASSGFEENGVTTIMFRKKIKAKEPTDHSLVDDSMHVIWARGQERGQYSHSPPSGLERGTAAVGDFYRPDEIKYHGHGAQRGFANINFFEEKKAARTGGVMALPDKCGGQWRLPADCDPSNRNNTCEYFASWEYLGQKRGKDSIRFTIKTRQSKHWTGIGFSDNKKMSQTDAVVGWVDPRSGRPYLMDAWLSGYAAPRADPRQDLQQTQGSIQDGVATLSFVRKRDTGDQKDLAFTDKQCLYMMFVSQGGPFDAASKRSSKHLQTPLVSDDRVCIRPCGPEPEEEEITTEPYVPGLSSYTMLVRITGLAENFKSPAQGSKEYEELSRQVADSLSTSLSRLKGYHAILLDGFMQNETQSLIAELTFKAIDSNTIEGSTGRALEGSAADGSDEEESREKEREKWEKAVRETLAQGKVGNLNVDPDFLVFEPRSVLSSGGIVEAGVGGGGFFGAAEAKLWVVVACVAALVVVALAQAACTLQQGRRHAQAAKDQLIPGAAWKEYASANTNYAFEPFENEEKYNGTTSTTQLRKTPAPKQRPSDPPPPRPASENGHKLSAHSQYGRDEFDGGHGGHAGHGGYGGHGDHGGRRASGGRATPRHGPPYYPDTRSLQRHRDHYGYGVRSERGSNSLPRGPRGEGGPPTPHGGPPLSPLAPHPDFYFMPSQRKYEDF